jgi:hypothetical protein
VLHTSCASAGWFSLENIPKAATPAKAFDAKLRRVKSFIPLLHFTCTGMSSSRNLLDRSLGAAFHTAPTESPRTSCGQGSEIHGTVETLTRRDGRVLVVHINPILGTN